MDHYTPLFNEKDTTTKSTFSWFFRGMIIFMVDLCMFFSTAQAFILAFGLGFLAGYFLEHVKDRPHKEDSNCGKRLKMDIKEEQE